MNTFIHPCKIYRSPDCINSIFNVIPCIAAAEREAALLGEDPTTDLAQGVIQEGGPAPAPGEAGGAIDLGADQAGEADQVRATDFMLEVSNEKCVIMSLWSLTIM